MASDMSTEAIIIQECTPGMVYTIAIIIIIPCLCLVIGVVIKGDKESG